MTGFVKKRKKMKSGKEMKQYPIKKQALANHETMAYRECGLSKNPTIVLIHGNQSSSLFFEETMEALEDSAHVIALDLIGFGESSYNRQINTLQDYSEDVALFLKEKGIADAVVLGWSTGGGIILELAADYPELCSRLVLLDSVGVQGYPLYKLDENLKPILTKRIYKREDVESEPVQVVPVRKAIEEKNTGVLKSGFDAVLYNLNPPEPARYEAYIGEILKERCINDVDTALACFNISDEYNGAVEGNGRIHQVKCPVTILHGLKDLIIPYSEAVKTAELLGDKADLFVLGGAGHALLSDRKESFIQILKNILQEK